MSETVQRDVIITLSHNDAAKVSDSVNWLKQWRSGLPEELSRLVVGPIVMRNGYIRFFFASSGSNEGWPLTLHHAVECEVLLRRFGRNAILVTQAEGEMPSMKNILYTSPPKFTEEDLLDRLDRGLEIPQVIVDEYKHAPHPWSTLAGKTASYLVGREAMNRKTGDVHPDTEVRVRALKRAWEYKVQYDRLLTALGCL